VTVAAPSTNGTRTSRPAASRPVQRPPSALELIHSTDRPETVTTASPESPAALQALQAQPLGFSLEQLAALSAPLDRANVRQREQGRSKVHYLEGWKVIAEANRIFGFDGWQRQTIAVRCVAQAERMIGARGTSRDQKPGWDVTYTARVRVIVTAGGLTPLVREGSGAGHGIDVDLGQAHEAALKEAETDAMKRALMTFGNPFGLALYDRRSGQESSSLPHHCIPGPGPRPGHGLDSTAIGPGQPRPDGPRCRNDPAPPQHPAGAAPAPAGVPHPGLPQAVPGARGGGDDCGSDQPEVIPQLD